MKFIRSLLGSQAHDKPDYREEAFNYQLEILKIELDLISQAFDRIDQMSQAIKNWSVVVWGGSIAVLLGVPDMRQFVVLTGLVVLPFWISEARWRAYIRRFIKRQNRISNFVNSPGFAECFRMRQMNDFTILDPYSRFATDEEMKGVNTAAAMMWPEVAFFYLGMIIISIAVGTLLLLTM